MADDVDALRAEAAEALASGDTAAANAAYARELELLAGAGAEPEAGAGDEGGAQAEPEQAAEPAEAASVAEDDDEPIGPVPVEITSRVYERMRAEFDDDQAAALQRAWGDAGAVNDALVGALAKDAGLTAIYESHQTDTGALTLDGAQAAADALKAAGAPPEVLDDPELERLYLDHMDERTGALSPAGVKIVLAHVARRWGYRMTRRATPRTETDTSSRETATMTDDTITAALKQQDELREVREQISEAQARGDSKRAGLLYQREMQIIAKQNGNRPAIGSRGRYA